MNVYAIRWESRIDGETDSGILDPCYANIDSAKKAMLEDMETTKKDWELNGDTVSSRVSDGETYCEITANEDDSYDYHEWHVTSLELVNSL